jgi:hypothetical protein
MGGCIILKQSLVYGQFSEKNIEKIAEKWHNNKI